MPYNLVGTTDIPFQWHFVTLHIKSLGHWNCGWGQEMVQLSGLVIKLLRTAMDIYSTIVKVLRTVPYLFNTHNYVISLYRFFLGASWKGVRLALVTISMESLYGPTKIIYVQSENILI